MRVCAQVYMYYTLTFIQKAVVWSVSAQVYVYHTLMFLHFCVCRYSRGEVGGWGRVPFSRNLMSPTPRRKWYLTTGRRFH